MTTILDDTAQSVYRVASSRRNAGLDGELADGCGRFSTAAVAGSVR
jgi:hypothetical protein